MPKSTTATKNGKATTTPEVEPDVREEETTAEEKEKRTGTGVNPFMQRLTPEMLSNPYPVDLRGGRTVNSFDFALAKLDSLIAKPLGLETEDEWIAFARLLFPYRQRAEEQRVEEQANRLLEDLKQNPDMLQRLVTRLSAELAAVKPGLATAKPSIFAEEYERRTPLDVSRYS